MNHDENLVMISQGKHKITRVEASVVAISTENALLLQNQEISYSSF